MDRASKEDRNGREDYRPEDNREEGKDDNPAEDRKIMKKRVRDNLPSREISHIPPLFSDYPFGRPHCMKLDIISRAGLRVKATNRHHRREPGQHISTVERMKHRLLRTRDQSHNHALAERMVPAEWDPQITAAPDRKQQ